MNEITFIERRELLHALLCEIFKPILNVFLLIYGARERELASRVFTGIDCVSVSVIENDLIWLIIECKHALVNLYFHKIEPVAPT